MNAVPSQWIEESVVRERIVDGRTQLLGRVLGPSLALRLLAVCWLVMLSACAAPPPASFDLSAAGGFRARAQRGQLAVLEPTAIQPERSNRIVVRTSVETVAYLGGAQWIDQLPVLLQARLIETFENARVFRGVGRLGILAEHSLSTEIRRFELDAPRGEAVVELFVRVSGSAGGVIASRLFSARAPVEKDDPALVAAALNVALGEVMREIVVWTAQKV